MGPASRSAFIVAKARPQIVKAVEVAGGRMFVFASTGQMNPGCLLDTLIVVQQGGPVVRPREDGGAEVHDPAQVLDHDRMERDTLVPTSFAFVMPGDGLPFVQGIPEKGVRFVSTEVREPLCLDDRRIEPKHVRRGPNR